MTSDRNLKKIEEDARVAMERAVQVVSPLENFFDPVEQLTGQAGEVRRTYAEQLVLLEERILDNLGNEFEQEGLVESSGRYSTDSGQIEVVSGKLPKGVGLAVSYSGVPRRSLVLRVFGSAHREITLKATMNAGEEDIRFPDLTLDFPESKDSGFERKVATYLNGIALRAAEEMLIDGGNGSTGENLNEIAYFEGRLVARVGRLLGSRFLANNYAKVKARSLMANKLAKLGADYKSKAEGVGKQLDVDVAGVRTKADEVSVQFGQRLVTADDEVSQYKDVQIQAVDAARDATLEQLRIYAEQRRPVIEGEIVREAQDTKRGLEKEADSLRWEIVRLQSDLEERKGPVNEAVVYFGKRLGSIFRDYDSEGTQNDVNEGVRYKHAGELATAMGQEKTKLGRDEMVSVLSALAANTGMSGFQRHNAGDVKALVGEVIWVARRVGQGYVGQVVERIADTGKKGRSRAPLQTVHSVLESLF